MKARGQAVLFPPNPAPHVIDWFLDIGPVVSGGMGDAAIGWQDIDAWCNRIGVDLDPWEARTIRQLSKAFISQRHEAKKPNCPAPYSNDLPAETRDKVTKQFAAMVGAFASRTAKR